MKIDAITATRQDISDGLTGPFEIQDINIDEELAGLENGSFSAVPWSVAATHVDWFIGLAPTQRSVVIEGVTIVKHPPEGEDPEFRRYIDWSAVLGQLGVAMTGRPMLATD